MNDNSYRADHLSTDEIRAVAKAVMEHWMAVMTGKADEDDMLYADSFELSAEYQFWSDELARRVDYGGAS